MSKPILFNAEMVRAILEGRKTVTRRIVKPQFPVYKSGEKDSFAEIERWGTHSFLGGHKNHPSAGTVLKPPCQAGDILYVRETWALPSASEIARGVDPGMYLYKADEPRIPAAWDKWRPSIHMPKEAARIWLRVTDVRAERLQEISFDDVIAEGTPAKYLEAGRPDNPYPNTACIQHPFGKIWDSTIKPAKRAAFGWEANPWVWVISFERCEKPEEENG